MVVTNSGDVPLDAVVAEAGRSKHQADRKRKGNIGTDHERKGWREAERKHQRCCRHAHKGRVASSGGDGKAMERTHGPHLASVRPPLTMPIRL